MTLYGEGIQTYAAMFDGFIGALDRFFEAGEGKDAARVYNSLFEALNWAVALDARTKELWAPRGLDSMHGWAWRDEVAGAGVLRGVRFARNAMQHDWAEVLELSHGGSGHPLGFPNGYFEWLWRPLSGLPPRGKSEPDGEAVYRESLAGRPVRSTLIGLGQAFGFLRSLLEPRRALGATP